jgi:hypothetical protein
MNENHFLSLNKLFHSGVIGQITLGSGSTREGDGVHCTGTGNGTKRNMLGIGPRLGQKGNCSGNTLVGKRINCGIESGVVSGGTDDKETGKLSLEHNRYQDTKK